jgi:hypothetical protein
MTRSTLKPHSSPVDESDVSVGMKGSAGEGWLDACCWRCGAVEPAQDSLGRLLCPPCRAELADDWSPPEDPLRVSRSAYWGAHVLERCWRCLTEGVDPQDDVGLCPACLATLAAGESTRREELIGP